MKSLSTYFAVLIMAVLLGACSQKDHSLEWLEGHWEMEEGGLITHEVWTQDQHQEWKGLGFSMDGEDSVFVEQMRIFKVRDSLFFEVYLPNALAPKYFKNISQENEKLDFYWPENDFPKHIIYQRKLDTLQVDLIGDEQEVRLNFLKQ